MRELSKYETLPEPAQIEKLFPDGLSTNSEKYSPLFEYEWDILCNDDSTKCDASIHNKILRDVYNFQ